MMREGYANTKKELFHFLLKSIVLLLAPSSYYLLTQKISIVYLTMFKEGSLDGQSSCANNYREGTTAITVAAALVEATISTGGGRMLSHRVWFFSLTLGQATVTSHLKATNTCQLSSPLPRWFPYYLHSRAAAQEGEGLLNIQIFSCLTFPCSELVDSQCSEDKIRKGQQGPSRILPLALLWQGFSNHGPWFVTGIEIHLCFLTSIFFKYERVK